VQKKIPRVTMILVKMSHSVTDKIKLLLQHYKPMTIVNSDKFACENLNVNIVCVLWVIKFQQYLHLFFCVCVHLFVYSSLM
jgi:hypothetical protein